MTLTNTAVRNIKPKAKTHRFFDGGGLYLEVAPGGGKWWRLKYRFDGKEKRISLGVYPDVSLKDARERRDETRKLIANEINPSDKRKTEKAIRRENALNNIEDIAREWHTKQKLNWSERHAKTLLERLEFNIFPYIGKRPITDITPRELLDVLRRIEKRGKNETARRVLGICGQIFRYGILTP